MDINKWLIILIVCVIIGFVLFYFSVQKDSFTKDIEDQHKGNMEGYTIPKQQEQMRQLIKHFIPYGNHVMEIGFNAGHSANAILGIHSDISLVSFDIGDHEYVNAAKAKIDEKYPNRHQLIIGDSRKTVPEYVGNPFDIIFIDGGHDYEIAKADLMNCKKLAHSNTLILMDDTVRKHPEWIDGHNHGPNRAWHEMIDEGHIVDLGFDDYTKGRGMSWGKYIF